MDYFRVLSFDKEPFANSPDPDVFYQSSEHQGCLQKVELSIRTRRGLSVVIGDVGAGKTTLCRHLLRKLSNEDNLLSHLILDPHFSSSTEFLEAVAGMFGLDFDGKDSDRQLKEEIKKYSICKRSRRRADDLTNY